MLAAREGGQDAVSEQFLRPVCLHDRLVVLSGIHDHMVLFNCVDLPAVPGLFYKLHPEAASSQQRRRSPAAFLPEGYRE